MKLRLSDKPPKFIPEGYSDFLDNFAWQIFSAAKPSEVAWADISIVQGVIAAFQKESRWKPDDDWKAEQVRIRSLRSPTGYRNIWEGDCKGLCWKLYQKLVKAGVEPGAMRLILARVDGSGHMFLAVETEPKTILYDCRKLGTFVWGSKRLSGIEWLAATDRGTWKEIEI